MAEGDAFVDWILSGGRTEKPSKRRSKEARKKRNAKRARQRAHKAALEEKYALWGGDPQCKHNEVPGHGGGVVCTKCGAWFCF